MPSNAVIKFAKKASGFFAAFCITSVFLICGSDFYRSAGEQKATTHSGLVCREGTWSFGEVDPSSTPRVSHTFNLENHSSKAISIENISVSCGCMVVDDYKSIIPAKGNANVVVSVSLSPVPGPVERKLVVETDTPGDRMLLRIVGIQKPNASLHAFPDSINFGVIAPGETKTRKVQIERWNKSPVQLQDVLFSDKHLSLARDALLQEDWRTRVEIQLDSNALAPGDYNAVVSIFCRHDTHKELTLPVRFTVGEANRVEVELGSNDIK